MRHPPGSPPAQSSGEQPHGHLNRVPTAQSPHRRKHRDLTVLNRPVRHQPPRPCPADHDRGPRAQMAPGSVVGRLEYARYESRPPPCREPSGSRSPSAVTHGTRPTPEQPWPVRTVARKIAEWVDRLGAVWVEGQLAQVTARAGTGTAFLVLRDPAADVSLQLTAPVGLVRDGGAAVAEGNRVVVHGKPSFFLGRGTLSLRVDTIRAVGIGELLARIERLRALLAAEGLFDAARKRRLPFLPACIGLITGRASAAEHDVVTGATARWPAVAIA